MNDARSSNRLEESRRGSNGAAAFCLPDDKTRALSRCVVSRGCETDCEAEALLFLAHAHAHILIATRYTPQYTENSQASNSESRTLYR